MINLHQLHRVVARPVPMSETAKNVTYALGGTYNNDILEELEDATQGVLAGQVAALDTNGFYTVSDEANATLPMGLFGFSAEGDPLESAAPRKNGGRIALFAGKGAVCDVEVYETRAAAAMGVANGLLATYVPGTLLYSSAQGFLTTEDADAQTPVAVVEVAPTASNKTMRIVLL